ncbi:MAG: ATP-binding protein [Calothrix sp. FI2-JRJ7]|nr:ATP-binding protein [Calothrix sp. FI2-JRJ7]
MTPAVNVIGDTARLQQVVWNLLSNAVKFTPQGGQIEVYLIKDGANAQIQVKDTGKGISSEFSRIYLSISSKKIVLQHANLEDSD